MKFTGVIHNGKPSYKWHGIPVPAFLVPRGYRNVVEEYIKKVIRNLPTR